MNVDVQPYAEVGLGGGGGGPNNWDDKGAVLLHSACVGDVDSVHAVLSDGFCDIDQVDKLGRSALHWCVERGHAAVVEALVTQYHASLDLLTNDSESPLMLAVCANRLDMVQLLLSYGPYLQHTNKEGASALHLAAAQGHSEIVRALISHGAWVELEDAEGESPLFYAIRESQTEIVKTLLESGASPAHPNNDQDTPLSLARECQSPHDQNAAAILSLLQAHATQPAMRQNLLEPFTRVEARSFGSSSGNLCGFLTKTI